MDKNEEINPQSDLNSLYLSPVQTLRKERDQEVCSFEHVYYLENDSQLAVGVSKDGYFYNIRLITDFPGPLVLHWGIAKHSRYEWLVPPSFLHPQGTEIFQQEAAETVFLENEGLKQLHIKVDEQEAYIGIPFVLRQRDHDIWLKDQGRNFFVPLPRPVHEKSGFIIPEMGGIADEIIENEMSRNSWTMMHRFNLCHDLLDHTGNDPEGLSLIFVWLRFSAIRQLEWQRNYNTKPRELSHSMDRLTLKLADLYSTKPEGREFIRLIMTTLGRGGEGQRIRDEILNIMHRHHIKEVSGHFMEEWHQKLHNNTTPDDVVLCEAYLEFLRNDGDMDLFYTILEQNGVSKERLKSYERPIVSRPDFIPHLKDPLIHDFEHFLGLLRAVHSGTDLGTSIQASRHLFDPEMHDLVDFIWRHRDDEETKLCTLVERITEARRRLKDYLSGNRGVRDLLFLDLALEDFLRVVVERNLHLRSDVDQLLQIIEMMLENLIFSKEVKEFTYCLNQLKRLMKMPYSEDTLSKEWSLQTKSVSDRVRRTLGNLMDINYKLIQPKAEFLGKAFQADSWTITLFSEEVIRGRPQFVLSALLRHLDSLLRKHADVGKWQVISPGRGAGQVEVVDNLKSTQGKNFDRPAIIVADRVIGDEEIPKGVTAVITQDAVDIVSHLSVRARNDHLLFATCYNQEMFGSLKSLRGHMLDMNVNSSGDVVFENGTGEADIAIQPSHSVLEPKSLPDFRAYVLKAEEFDNSITGAKANNLNRLQGKLPEWINLPISAALPFGIFEKVIAQDDNNEAAKEYYGLVRHVGNSAELSDDETLKKIRKIISDLKAPDELISSLQWVMNEIGLPQPASWEDTWVSVKKVWGSKWNERAYLSRKKRGIPHEAVFMAILIQKIVESEYSFVIHTINPLNNNRDEVYSEVVLGHGETLVGNYPGRALSFICRKGKDEPEIITFPSKSLGLFGGGLIFRSDSSGEDLAGFAGAGLYDSVMLPSPRDILLDYGGDDLVWNEDFRRDFLINIAKIGIIIEEIMGCPQDIEGAYSKGRYYVLQARPQVGTKNG